MDDAWNPEHGDDAWLPDLTRSADDYSDAELRFCPLYRLVRERIERRPWPPTEADILATTREALRDTLPDDKERAELIAAMQPDPDDE